MSKSGVFRIVRWLRKADDGTAIIELALVAPVFIALMIGAVETGRYADYAIKVANAARAGVAYGSQSLATASDNSGMQAAALADAQSMTGLTATAKSYCTCADGSADAGCVIATCSSTHRIVYVQVQTTGKLNSIFDLTTIPGLPASLGSITVNSTAIMRVAE